MMPSDYGLVSLMPYDHGIGSVSYVKIKECYAPIAGIYRIKFGLYTESASYAAFGCVYKNGVAYGTERSTVSLTEVTFTEDLFFNEGDLIQGYCHIANSLAMAHILNFKSMGKSGSGVVNLD